MLGIVVPGLARNHFMDYLVERMCFTAMRPEVTAKDEAVPSPTFRS